LPLLLLFWRRSQDIKHVRSAALEQQTVINNYIELEENKEGVDGGTAASGEKLRRRRGGRVAAVHGVDQADRHVSWSGQSRSSNN